MKVGSIEWSQYRITWGFEDGTPKDFADDVRRICFAAAGDSNRQALQARREDGQYAGSDEGHLTATDGHLMCPLVCHFTAAGNNNMSPEYLTRTIRRYLPQYEIPFSAYHRMNVFILIGMNFDKRRISWQPRMFPKNSCKPVHLN